MISHQSNDRGVPLIRISRQAYLRLMQLNDQWLPQQGVKMPLTSVNRHPILIIERRENFKAQGSGVVVACGLLISHRVVYNFILQDISTKLKLHDPSIALAVIRENRSQDRPKCSHIHLRLVY